MNIYFQLFVIAFLGFIVGLKISTLQKCIIISIKKVGFVMSSDPTFMGEESMRVYKVNVQEEIG